MLQISDRPPNETVWGFKQPEKGPLKKNGWDSPRPIHIPQADWRGYAIISSYIRINQTYAGWIPQRLVASPGWFGQEKPPPGDLAEPYQVRPRNLPRKKSSPCRAASRTGITEVFLSSQVHFTSKGQTCQRIRIKMSWYRNRSNFCRCNCLCFWLPLSMFYNNCTLDMRWNLFFLLSHLKKSWQSGMFIGRPIWCPRIHTPNHATPRSSKKSIEQSLCEDSLGTVSITSLDYVFRELYVIYVDDSSTPH